jgi:hypothetical protein
VVRRPADGFLPDDEPTLGTPLPSVEAAALSLVLAAIAGPLWIRWMGGDAIVNADMTHDAATQPCPRVARGAARHHAEHGFSGRDMRILHAFMLFPPIFAVMLQMAFAINRATAAEPVDVPCRVHSIYPKNANWDITLQCTLPSGEASSASGLFASQLSLNQLTARTRRGGLGGWLLEKDSVHDAPAPR